MVYTSAGFFIACGYFNSRISSLNPGKL